MRKTPLILLFLLFGQLTAALGQTETDKVEGAVKAFYQSVEDLDFVSMRTMITPEFEIVDGGKRMDIGQFEKFLKEGVATGFRLDFELSEFNTEIGTDIAYTSFRTVNPAEERAFFESAIFRRKDGTWLLDRFHSTPVR